MKSILKSKKIISLICVILMLSMMKTTSLASNLLYADVFINYSYVGTYNNGYKYNATLMWEETPLAVNGYYVAVQNAQTGVWVIKTSCAKNIYYDDMYGLSPGTYNFYVSALDANYKLLDTHWGYRVYVDYSGNYYQGVYF